MTGASKWQLAIEYIPLAPFAAFVDTRVDLWEDEWFASKRELAGNGIS